MTTPAPDLPDFTGAQQPVTVPTRLTVVTLPAGFDTAVGGIGAFDAIIVTQTQATKCALNISQSAVDPDHGGGPTPDNITTTGNAIIPVTGNEMFIINTDPVNPATVVTFGSGKPTQVDHALIAGWVAEPFSATVTNAAMVAGNNYPLVAATGSLPFQGPAYIRVNLSSTTMTGDLLVETALGQFVTLVDSGEMHVDPAAGQAVGKIVALPGNVASFVWKAGAAGSCTVTLKAIPNY